MPFAISYLGIGATSAILYGTKEGGQFVRAAFLVKSAGDATSSIYPPQGDDPSTWPVGNPGDANWVLLLERLVQGRYVVVIRPDCHPPIYLEFLIVAGLADAAGFSYPTEGAQIPRSTDPNAATRIWAYGSSTHNLTALGTDATNSGNVYGGTVTRQPGQFVPWLAYFDVPYGETGATALQVTNMNGDNPHRNVVIV